MKLGRTAERLKGEFERWTVIDAHEHLLPESERVSQKVDVFVLFSHYTRVDLISAGMKPEEYQWVMDASQDLHKRWKLFKPYLEQIRYGSYARPAFIAAKELFGFQDINDETYEGLSEALAEQNKPGIYRRILREKCNIEKALVNTRQDGYDLDLMALIKHVDIYCAVESREFVEQKANALGMEVRSLDDYVEVIKAGLRKWKTAGVVGLKSRTGPYVPPSREAAEEVFSKLMSGGKAEDGHPLDNYLRDKMYEMAAEEDLTVAVHTGMWGDFTKLQAVDFMPVMIAHPGTRFDIFHAGFPSPRETGVIGKNFGNASLNLCWCHIISQQMTCATLQEWIDLVPVSKIIGFGADYGRPVEKTYGHLVMAREDIAQVLGERVDKGLIGFDEALMLARKFFYENPKRIYELD